MNTFLKPEYMDLPAVADRLDLKSHTHARRVVSAAKLKAAGQIGNVLIYRRDDVEALADQRRRTLGVRSPKVAR